MDGVLVVDKPKGLTSRQVMLEVRRLLGAAKTGHAGTLDPLATGVLPVCVGRGTLLSGYLSGGDKEYRVVALLGVETDTYDVQGEVTATAGGEIPGETEVREALRRFEGEFPQVPPPYSAVKHRGRPLYHYARRGVDVRPRPRKVIVHDLELVSIEYGGDKKSVEILARCGSGTYIRSIVHDLGRELGCGACVSELRRTAAGALTLGQATTLEELETMEPGERLRKLVSLEVATAGIPRVPLTGEGVRAASLGGKLRPEWLDGVSVAELPSGTFRVIDSDGRLVALYGPRKPTDPPDVAARAVRVIRPASHTGGKDEAA